MAAVPHQILDDLLSTPAPVGPSIQHLPAAHGVYAWWAAPSVLPLLEGRPNPADPEVRLLHVGMAINIAARSTVRDLRRTDQSPARRTLAALLRTPLGLVTTWKYNRVVLQPESEATLTGWMTEHLQMTWAVTRAPESWARPLVHELQPPMNTEFVEGPSLEVVRAAQRDYLASAGERPPSSV